ncbi:MAG: nucleotide-gated potassium channel protein [Bdellovibrionaceae bacterium]|nr:nucleotide-gated potassium channel protein [Pseudobdellovibrionaceae bacterium]
MKNLETSEDLKLISAAPGEVIFNEGDLGYDFYIVQGGEIEIRRTDADGDQICLAKLGAGELFGEFALLSTSPRSATAVATQQSELLRVSEKGYQELLGQLPEWSIKLMESMVGRLKAMNEHLVQTDQFRFDKPFHGK